MEPTHCTICEKTRHIPSSQMWAIVTFGQKYQVENALYAIEKSHIIPSVVQIFTKEEIEEMNQRKENFLEKETVVFQMHGIKDIIYLQLLYLESICKEHGALTFDTSSKNPFGKMQN